MADFLTQRQRVTDTSGVLLFLTVDAPSFTGPFQVVSDTKSWESNGVEYAAAPFGFTLPDDVAGQAPRSRLQIANPGSGVADELERVQGNEAVWATISIADRGDPDTYWAQYPMPLVNVTLTTPFITAQAGWDHIDRGQAVRIIANGQTLGRPA